MNRMVKEIANMSPTMSLVLDRHKGSYRARVDVDALTARLTDSVSLPPPAPIPQIGKTPPSMGKTCKDEFFENIVDYLANVYGPNIIVDYTRLRKNMDEYVDEFSWML